MKVLTETYRVKLSRSDRQMLNELRRFRIVPAKFVRQAIRDKIQKELPVLIQEEKRRLSKDHCPF